MDTPLSERVAIVETKIKNIADVLTTVQLDVNSIKKTIWQAAGAAAVIVFLLEHLLGK